jgi:MFS family permease
LLSVAFLALLVRVERRADEPFIALSLFRRRPYVGATATVLLHNLVMYSLLLIIPVFVERQLDLGPSAAGVVIGAMTGAMMICSPIGGQLSDRISRRAPVIAGSLIAIAATVGLVFVADNPTAGTLAGLVGLAGVGVGLAGASLQTTAVESSPRAMVGVASGVFMTARYTGGIAASGIAAAVASSEAFRSGFVVLAVGAAISVAPAAALARGRLHRDQAHGPT